jgi:hypothetical protein
MLDFLREHGPDSETPLPVLPWHVDKSGHCFAEITGGTTRDLDTAQLLPARVVLAAYATAAGATVEERDGGEGKRELVVLGKIGPALPELGFPGRSTFVLNAVVDADPPGLEGGAQQ